MLTYRRVVIPATNQREEKQATMCKPNLIQPILAVNLNFIWLPSILRATR